MCYPDRSSDGKCIHNSFTVCKRSEFSVRVILGRGIRPMPFSPRQAGLRLPPVREVAVLGATEHCGRDCKLVSPFKDNSYGTT